MWSWGRSIGKDHCFRFYLRGLGGRGVIEVYEGGFLCIGGYVFL